MRGFVQSQASLGLDKLHSAMSYLARQFDNSMPRDRAEANLQARALLWNSANAILKEGGEGIGKAEVNRAKNQTEELSEKTA